VINIHVNDQRAKQALQRLLNMKGAISSLLALVAANFQQEVQKNANEQGSQYGRWVPASKWIIAKEGRSKLFPDVAERIRVRANPERAEVVFQGLEDWTLTQHEKGFTTPPSGTIVTLDLKQPAALGWNKSKFSFFSRNPSRVPARKFWPTDEKAKKTAQPLIAQWAKQVEAELTR
jgi:hypothetical protein